MKDYRTILIEPVAHPPMEAALYFSLMFFMLFMVYCPIGACAWLWELHGTPGQRPAASRATAMMLRLSRSSAGASPARALDLDARLSAWL